MNLDTLAQEVPEKMLLMDLTDSMIVWIPMISMMLEVAVGPKAFTVIILLEAVKTTTAAMEISGMDLEEMIETADLDDH